MDQEEWDKRRAAFSAQYGNVKSVFEKICRCVPVKHKSLFDAFCRSPNRELVYNLYTYIWDIVGVMSMLLSYIDWLALGHFSPQYKQLIVGRHTWFSGIREAFMSGDHEPWVFRGGLAADLQRLMPVDSGNDLFLYQFPETPTSEVFDIRPYEHRDEGDVYRICLQTYHDGMDASQDFPSHTQLVGDKCIGPLINFYPGLGFVFENNQKEVVGYIFSAPCLKEFQQKVEHAWLPQMRKKYPRVEQDDGELLTPCDLTVNSLHREQAPLRVEEPETYGVCRLAMHQTGDASLARRATTLLLACLRTTGTLKVVAEVPRKEKYMMDLYTKLGFSGMEVQAEEGEEGPVIMMRRY